MCALQHTYERLKNTTKTFLHAEFEFFFINISRVPKSSSKKFYFYVSICLKEKSNKCLNFKQKFR